MGKNDVPHGTLALGLLTLLFVTCFAAPEIASAQTIVDPTPQPAPPPPVQLFKEKVPESGGRLIESIKSSSWAVPPPSGSEVPRFTIGHTVAFKTGRGVELSAGLFGRRSDPLPLFMSQSATRAMQRDVTRAVTEPSIYRLRWDAKFGVAAPLWNSPQFKMNGTGEVFVPLPGSTDRSTPFIRSRAVQVGGVMGF
jgi:hypothetical protein